MKQGLVKRGLAANALWNVATGLSSAVVALVVPPVLSRTVSGDAYGAWALALQMGAYVNILGFTLQVAVGRFTGSAEASGDRPLRDRITATAFWALVAVAAAGVALMCALSAAVDRLFPEMAAPLRSDLAGALPLIALSFGAQLPVSALAGVFNGLHRSDIPARILSCGRLATAAVLVGALLLGHRSLILLAALHLAASIATAGALAAAWRARVPGPSIALSLVTRSSARELAAFCGSLLIWNVSMLLIGGFDLMIVGRHDVASLSGFAAATTLATFIAGLLQALAMPIIPAAADLQARAPADLPALLARASRLVLSASLLVMLPLLAGGAWVLETWLGVGYARAMPLLGGLLAAAFIRNLMLPYAMVAVGTGRQHRMLATPLAEGILCLAGSLLLAPRMGAVGVVVAKAGAGLAGVLLLLAQNALGDLLPRSTRATLLAAMVGRPLLVALPALAVIAGSGISARPVPAPALGFLILCVAAGSIWAAMLTPADREQIRRVLRHRAPGMRKA